LQGGKEGKVLPGCEVNKQELTSSTAKILLFPTLENN